MNDWLKGFLLQLRFLTRIPVPGKIRCEDHLLIKGFVLAPLIGLLIGLALAAAAWLMRLTGQPVLAVMAVITVEILITGALHLDGFADTCDGLFSCRPADRVLEIMKDPHTGVFGVTGILLLLAWKIALLFLLDNGFFFSWLICMPVVSRACVVLTAGVSRYAGKEKGLGAVYTERTGPPQMIIAGLCGTACCLVFSGLYFFVPALAAVGSTLAACYYFKKKIGGITGDIMGYTIEISEVVFLATALLLEILFLETGG